MPSTVEPKSLNELDAMHTGSLMSRRKALLKCEKSFDVSDQNVRENTGLIEFKNTKEWIDAYRELKQVLSSRENVPKKIKTC